MFRFVPILAMLLVLAACSSPPFVYKQGEFNRASADFGKDVTDITEVTVCYSAYSSTPKQVSTLASKECGKFGKTTVFVDQTRENCPLQTPVSANYMCVAP